MGPITVNCNNAHSTTSPKTSPTQIGLLATASAPLSPPEDDISVTASPTPSPQPSSAFPGVTPTAIHNNHLFNNALAASLFLNAPLLPPPGQWLYSQFYPQEWPWMNLRQNSLMPSLPRLGSPKDFGQNPDSSSSIDITDVDERKEDDEDKPEREDLEKIEKGRDEGINLTVHRGRKAAITLVRQKEEVSSSEKSSRSGRHSDVWRPY